MTIKQLAFDAQKHLQTKTGTALKRSHIYELLAAAFGFNSYASFCSDCVFTQETLTRQRSSGHNEIIGRRSLELSYPPETALQLSHAIPAFLAEQKISAIRIEDLVAFLLGETTRPTSHAFDEDDFEDFDGDVVVDEDTYDFWDDQDSEVSPILLEGLTAAADRHSACAHYALALISAPQDDPYESSAGSDFWYQEQLNGRILTGVEKEWADEYETMLNRSEKYEYHLRAAGMLGHKRALLDLAEFFDDPIFFEQVSADSKDIDPARAADVAEYLGRDVDVWRWRTTAAEKGDIEAMRELIEGHDQSNLYQCRVWFYLAELLGTNLEKDEYRAINEDGSDYDDDIGGPLYIGGRGGVKLPPLLNTAEDADARRKATALFSAIRPSRKLQTN